MLNIFVEHRNALWQIHRVGGNDAEDKFENIMSEFSITGLKGITLGTITVKGHKTVLKRNRKAQAQGFQFHPMNDRDFCAAALYLQAETAAISCVCNGYTISKA